MNGRSAPGRYSPGLQILAASMLARGEWSQKRPKMGPNTDPKVDPKVDPKGVRKRGPKRTVPEARPLRKHYVLTPYLYIWAPRGCPKMVHFGVPKPGQKWTRFGPISGPRSPAFSIEIDGKSTPKWRKAFTKWSYDVQYAGLDSAWQAGPVHEWT